MSRPAGYDGLCLKKLSVWTGLAILHWIALPGCVEQRCTTNQDCPAPRICSEDGRCAYACSLDSDCGPGFTCQLFTCVPVEHQSIQCPDEMVPVQNIFCIDKYEASKADASSEQPGVDLSGATSRPDVLPWEVGDDNEAAAAACSSAGKRLCTQFEWELACRGPHGAIYGYGQTYEPETCNGIDTFGAAAVTVLPTGSLEECANDWGAFDMNGNLWEHVAEGDGTQVRGGAYNCIDSMTLHRCDYVPRTWVPSALGFRCCWTPPDSRGTLDVQTLEDVASQDIPTIAETVETGGCLDPDVTWDYGHFPPDETAQPDNTLEDVPCEIDSASDIIATDWDVVDIPDTPSEASDILQEAFDVQPDLMDVTTETVEPEACPSDMVLIADQFCLDRYEASRVDATASSQGSDTSIATSKAGVIPWFPVDLATATAACLAAGKRVCTEAEMNHACGGTDGHAYIYGDTYSATTCNGIDAFCNCSAPPCSDLEVCPYPHCYSSDSEGVWGQGCGAYFHVTPTGSFPDCQNSDGAFDINGNVWELVDIGNEESWYKGGAYNCSNSEYLHDCGELFQNISAKGFRCCLDVALPGGGL